MLGLCWRAYSCGIRIRWLDVTIWTKMGAQVRDHVHSSSCGHRIVLQVFTTRTRLQIPTLDSLLDKRYTIMLHRTRTDHLQVIDTALWPQNSPTIRWSTYQDAPLHLDAVPASFRSKRLLTQPTHFPWAVAPASSPLSSREHQAFRYAQ